ncbi:MAG TPA: GGDEF domain-containing protein [Burkholderiales bacterium]
MDEQAVAAQIDAFHDALTGLPNRRLLDDRLQQLLHLARRRTRQLAVVLMDLDNFKQVNDERGHAVGDAVLREVAARLARCVRKADTVARHGADEFALVLCDLQAEAGCRLVAERLLRTMAEEIPAQGRPVALAVSVGISLFPADAGDGEALLRNAGAALHRAKQAGHNQYAFYGR